MTLEKWLEIKEKIKQEMEDVLESVETDEERRKTTEILEFRSPLGKMRIEWITRPKVLDKQTHFSRRIGSDVKVDYVYSEDEFTYTFKVYREVAGDWEELKGGSFGF